MTEAFISGTPLGVTVERESCATTETPERKRLIV